MEDKKLDNLSDIENPDILDIRTDKICAEFDRKLKEAGIKDIVVEYAEIEDYGIDIFFGDEEDLYSVSFVFDMEDGPVAVVSSGDEEDTVVELKSLTPPVVSYNGKWYIELQNLTWLKNDILYVILEEAGLELISADDEKKIKYDEFGQVLNPSVIESFEISEFFKMVVRGGKRKKLNVVKRTRKKRLTSKQRMSARRGAMKRKRKMAIIKRKRAKSLSIRKRSHVKSNLPRSKFGFKAA